MESPNIIDRINQWLERSITVKLFSIGFLVLVLLIPSAWIINLIEERQARAEEAITEVASKWSGPQTIAGPLLVVPYKYTQVSITDGKETRVEKTGKAFFLPEQLKIHGTVTPRTLHRGIFDAVVYESTLQLDADLPIPDLTLLGLDNTSAQWNEAFLVCGISDLRGISANPSVKVDEREFPAEPSNKLGVRFDRNESGIIVPLHMTAASKMRASLRLEVKGSDQLYFSPVGKTTDVKIEGPWSTPSFDGAFLPTTRSVGDASFTATWQILPFNRPFESEWTGPGDLGDSNFGIKLLPAVDQYQKSTRTAKYGVLVILFTFVALLLLELSQKVRIHPFQYILIGAALIVYYTLLLSISEQLGFNAAYWLSGVATVLVTGAYSATFLHRPRLVMILSSLLTVFYLFIFVVVTQQEYSLLIGSIGLFLVTTLLMYFSRKIQWYKKEQ